MHDLWIYSKQCSYDTERAAKWKSPIFMAKKEINAGAGDVECGRGQLQRQQFNHAEDKLRCRPAVPQKSGEISAVFRHKGTRGNHKFLKISFQTHGLFRLPELRRVIKGHRGIGMCTADILQIDME